MLDAPVPGGEAKGAQSPQPEPIFCRRLLAAALALVVVVLLAALAWRVFAPGGWDGFEILGFLCLLGTLPWTGLCAANALLGLWLLLTRADPAGAVLPQLRLARTGPPQSPTAIALCVRNEDLATALPPLAALLNALENAAPGAFSAWVLSDTQAPALVASEAATFQEFAAAHPALPLHYRRRAQNTGYKAGNLMEFLDQHAGDARYALCLDADSIMSAPAVLRLVACMEADPRLAILQHLTVGQPARAAFPRLFQFGMRAGMRIWATGQAWWQGDQGPYWGHNALLRIAPFRQHARLAPLRDGSPILSHDQIEACRLHAAGWKVRVLPLEEGSTEANPPDLETFLARDRRWAAGNMQYLELITRPGETAMARWQMAQAVLLFATAPLWILLLLAAMGHALAGAGSGAGAGAGAGAADTPRGSLALLITAIWLALFSPKLLGYAELLCRPARAAPYGGRRAVLRGALAEILFTTLLDPIALLHKTGVLLSLPFGRLGWAPQRREEEGLSWGRAARLYGPHSGCGLLVFVPLLLWAPAAFWWALPWAGGLLLAIPFAVITAGPGFSAMLRRHGLAATPEERAEAMWRQP